MVLIKITARHKGVTEESKEYAYHKAEKLSHYLDRITKIEFILGHDKNIAQVELIVAATRGIMLVSRAVKRAISEAIDVVTAKMEKQLIKLKERLRSRRARDFSRNIKGKYHSEEISFSGLEQEDWY